MAVDLNKSYSYAPVQDVARNTTIRSYSDISRENIKTHLDSVFKPASADELEEFSRYHAGVRKVMKCAYTALGAMIILISLADASAAVCLHFLFHFDTNNALILACVFFVLAVVLGYCGLVQAGYTDTGSTYDWSMIDTLRKATQVYICDTGAGTTDTNAKLEWQQHIARYVLRPCHCTNYHAFQKIITNEHSVYAVYSEKTHAVVFVDPKLFE